MCSDLQALVRRAAYAAVREICEKYDELAGCRIKKLQALMLLSALSRTLPRGAGIRL